MLEKRREQGRSLHCHQSFWNHFCHPNSNSYCIYRQHQKALNCFLLLGLKHSAIQASSSKQHNDTAWLRSEEMYFCSQWASLGGRGRRGRSELRWGRNWGRMPTPGSLPPPQTQHLAKSQRTGQVPNENICYLHPPPWGLASVPEL